MVSPVSPTEVKRKLPDFVIESVNELIEENFLEKRPFKILKKDVVQRIKDKQVALNNNEPFNVKWLDFEDVYRKAGWDVDYDKPAYDETYDAVYTFSKRHATY